MRIRILIFLAVALIATTRVAGAHGEPEILVTPERVEAGGTIHVKGMMVSENGTIVVTLESAKYRAALGVARGDAEGNFEMDFTVPDQVPVGDYQVRALGSDGREATAHISVLEAGASTAGGGASATEIGLTLRDGMLTAILRDADGKPLAEQPMAFTQKTIFGVLTLGAARTDAIGAARLPLESAPDRETEIAAVFEGNTRYGKSRAPLTLNQGVKGEYALMEASLITPNPPLLLGGVIFGLLAIAWGLYTVVVYHLFRIVKPRRAEPVRQRA